MITISDERLDSIYGAGLRPLCLAKSQPCDGIGETLCACPVVKTGKGAQREKRAKQTATYDETAETYANIGIHHKEFPSLSRVMRDMIITEKIDGSNAAIGITEDGIVYAQSRKRIIEPGPSDLAGFAAFVQENRDQLIEQLGPGLHFGEWWGQKIQRTYGRTDRTFSLFNVGRWDSPFNQAAVDAGHVSWLRDEELCTTRCIQCPLVHVVPILQVYTFNTTEIESTLDHLMAHGSYAAPFAPCEPEGVVIYHTASKQTFKYTPDDRHKGER